MCRVSGCVAAEALSTCPERFEGENPLIRQPEVQDSHWGPITAGGDPTLVRFPAPAPVVAGMSE